MYFCRSNHYHMSLKQKTARSLKWNIIDRVGTQVLYGITGIVLARELSEYDFGLIGALLIFQAFAALFVDSGFAYALIQRERPTKLDYSTILWFNLGVATLVYCILFLAAPLIPHFFQDDQQLIPLARVQFLVLILNASAIVQTNRLVKAMEVRMVAVSNSVGLASGGIVGIYMALNGYGAWALVWQTLTIAAIKSGVLWFSTRWRPLLQFSIASLRSYFGIGSRMMLTYFFNSLFLNIYGFFIGNRGGLVNLGYYTQADKWSKMGVSSLTQVLTSTFLPALSAVQSDLERYRRILLSTHSFTAYLLFPAMLGLAALALPIFHTLFGAKWDPSVILFQIMLLRGIFVVLQSLYSNYLLALGLGNDIVRLEIVTDTAALVALALAFPFINASTPGDPVLGIRWLLQGQLAASALSWSWSLYVLVKRTGIKPLQLFRTMVQPATLSVLSLAVALTAGAFIDSDFLRLCVEGTIAISIYLAINHLTHSPIQAEAFRLLRRKKQ